MKLNGIEITSAVCVSEFLGDELFIYNEERQVIVALNEVAKFIWEYIIEKLKIKQDITTDEIASELISLCEEPVPDVEVICIDINETIERFFEASLIKKVECD